MGDQLSEQMNALKSKYSANEEENQEKADFMSQMKKFNPKETEGMLKTFQAEAKKQAELSTELDDNTEEKLAKCRTFFDKYNSKVPEQLDILKNLNSDLRSLVLDNEEKRQRDAELNQLVKSVEYQKLANELRELSTVVTDLNFFLIQHGLRDFNEQQ